MEGLQPWDSNITEGGGHLAVIVKDKERKPWDERLYRGFVIYSTIHAAHSVIHKVHAAIHDWINSLNLPIGRPKVLNNEAIIKKQESQAAFKRLLKDPDLAMKSPPKNLTIPIKTATRTFNHVSDYVIHNGLIWYRRRNETDQPWVPMYFDGYPDREAKEIQADGARLIVIDDQGYIHYRAVLKEVLRIFEIEAQECGAPKKHAEPLAHNKTHAFTIKEDVFENEDKTVVKKRTIWVRDLHAKHTRWQPFHFEGWPDRVPEHLLLKGDQLIIYDEKGQEYVENVSSDDLKTKLRGQSFPYRYHYGYFATTLDAEDKWQDRWFTLPVASMVNEVLKQKKLKLPEDVVDYAISNRGGFSACWEDFAGSEHPSCPGSELPKKKDNFSPVTGLYAVRKGENFIRFADPWLPGGFDEKSIPGIADKKIDFPPNFIFEKLSVSASMLFISGTDAITGARRLFCKLADFDTTRLNRFLPDQVLEDIKDPAEVKPADRVYHRDSNTPWEPIPLDGLEDQNVDFKTNTILQTGRGNRAKELRLASADSQGFYRKSMLENVGWEWCPLA